jgi:hypothetical protein
MTMSELRPKRAGWHRMREAVPQQPRGLLGAGVGVPLTVSWRRRLSIEPTAAAFYPQKRPIPANPSPPVGQIDRLLHARSLSAAVLYRQR